MKSYRESIISSYKLKDSLVSTTTDSILSITTDSLSTTITTMENNKLNNFSFDFKFLKDFIENEKFYDFLSLFVEWGLLLLIFFCSSFCFILFYKCGLLKKNTWTVIDYFFRKVDYEVLKKIVEVCSNSMREKINRENRDEELLQSSFQNNNFRFTNSAANNSGEILRKTQSNYFK
jgi:hypothetical protein